MMCPDCGGRGSTQTTDTPEFCFICNGTGEIGCPICGAYECERDSDTTCDICNTKCCHPNVEEWHWTQKELDDAKEAAKDGFL